MDRSRILRWLLLAAGAFLLVQFVLPYFGIGGGAKTETTHAFKLNDTKAPADRAPEELCTLEGSRFKAELSTRGGSLRHFWLTDRKYTTTGKADAPPIDLVTTSLESRMPLRTDLRVAVGDSKQQVEHNDLDYKLTAHDDKSCTFTFDSADTTITKVIATTGSPFELSVTTTVTNKADVAKVHRYAIEQTAWRTTKETEGHLGRQSEFLTKTELDTTEKVQRHSPTDFEPGDFKDEEFTAEEWRRAPGVGRWAAVNTSYFANAIVAIDGPAPPFAEDQIEEVYSRSFAKKESDPNHGHIYRARLAYPPQTLAPNASVTYKDVSFVGPKERAALNAIGGGGHNTSELLDLGWFSPIGKILVQYVYLLFNFTKSWGWAIVLLTITVKVLLFPLSIAQIKSSIAMRRLKPEMDEINAKYKGDATQRGLALQELWRKNKVSNPVAGCAPMLLQMPIWFALYTALQTAVELYHVPFGPFIPDLSAPGKYYIIPIVLGASSLFQQKLMPPQGDPQQQKMMMWMMPGIFTVMMLFLPAGLGVYMLTNTWLGIVQQLLMERYLKSRGGPGAAGAEIEVREKISGTDRAKEPRPVPVLGKGKARDRG
jgi:YidC/Oxa1 family membrane protein insertase